MAREREATSRMIAAVSSVRPRRAALLNDTQFSFGLILHLRKSFTKARLSLSLSCITVSPVPGSSVGEKWMEWGVYLEDTIGHNGVYSRCR
jgi:hypothetical protein